MNYQAGHARIGWLVATILAGAGIHVTSCSSDIHGGGGAGSSGSGGGGLAMPVPESCDAPKAYPTAAFPTGYVLCADGVVHRPEVVACHSYLATHVSSCGQGTGGGAPAGCFQDSDCTEHPNGYCDDSYDSSGSPLCACQYGCFRDSDCAAGEICLCGDPAGQCYAATCTSDADCHGKFCATYDSDPGCGIWKFACDAEADSCHGDGDCSSNDACGLSNGQRACLPADCAIGRPFLVEDAPRVAATTERDDWCAADVAPALEGLDATTRAALAEHWTRAARMEHASIAAFARFTLDLLALGAAPELVARLNAALADETRHARTCFGFASAYAGAAVGPGPLDIDGALEGRDPRTILMTAIVEGCVGETVAALEAAEGAARATDPVVRAALAGIAVDEARHAELAWDFVAWSLTRHPELRAAAHEAFAAATADAPSTSSSTASFNLAAALRDVVLPLESGLLAA